MERFYTPFTELRNKKFDGMIITGAPVEQFEYEQVTYWKELQDIFDWSRTHVQSTMFICWASQAALYHFYGVPKYPLDHKMFGIFKHGKTDPKCPIFRGFDDEFYVPHSRHSEVRREDILKHPELEIMAESRESGVYMVMERDGREIYVTGHSEYAPDTLDKEYKRDLAKGLPIDMPVNYYRDGNPNNGPLVRWRSVANLLFTNWLNYYVYQATPFDINEIQ
jgi:homoserine O-succinyltransferase